MILDHIFADLIDSGPYVDYIFSNSAQLLHLAQSRLGQGRVSVTVRQGIAILRMCYAAFG